MASEQGVPVELYIYDLTNGMASLLSPAIIGRQVEGVWHTSIVVYEREFFYGAGGVTSCAPGGTQLGPAHQTERLGETFVPFQVFADYLQGLATTTYTPSAYRLLEHNCNHFSEEIAQFLCGAHVPKHIVNQQDHLLSPPQRLALQALLDNLVPPATHIHAATRAQAHREPAGPPALAAAAPRPAGAARQPRAARHAERRQAISRRQRPGRRSLRRFPTSVVQMFSASVYANGVRHSRQDSPEYLNLNNQIEEARVQSAELEQRRSTLAEKLARKERKKEKKRKKQHAQGDAELQDDMAEAVETLPREEEVSRAGPSSAAVAAAAELLAEPRAKPRDPPIVYKDVDGVQEYERLAKALEGVELTPEERQSLDELQQYLVHGEGSWVLGDEFLSFVGRLLNDAALGPAVREATLASLSACALREDVSLLLHQDRRQHALLTYAHRIDALALPEQRALARLMCNLFENISSSEWLLYISEWDADGHPLSNIRATTKVCVHSCLSDDAELRETGTALMYNIATKEVKTVRLAAGRALRDLLPKGAKSKVFDEVCVELAMALLQLLQCAPCEEHLFRACAALARLAAHSGEVPQLIAIVGPDPAAYRGTSPRVDEQIDLIMKRVK